MKPIDFGVQEPYLSYIKSGVKTVEGRLNKGKFQSLQVGDILRLKDGSELKYEVIGKELYNSFAEMIEAEGIERVVPDKNSIEEACDVYYTFFTPEQENQFGVVGIEIKKITKET